MKALVPARNTLVVDVAKALRQMILSGEFPRGSSCPSQKDLSLRFGVALSTIHEAIQVLSSAGLVQSRPGKGTWVRDDALDGLIHPVEVRSRFRRPGPARWSTEARLVIETALTEFAAERASEADIARIRGRSSGCGRLSTTRPPTWPRTSIFTSRSRGPVATSFWRRCITSRAGC